MFLREDLAFRGFEVVAVEHAVEPVASAGAHLNQTSAVGHECPQFTHVYGRHPDFGDEVGGKEVGQAQDVVAIGFHTSFRDPLDLRRVGDDDLGHQRLDLVVDIPGVCGGFEDDLVRWEKVGPGPGCPLLDGNASRGEDDFLSGVDTPNDQIMFMEINGQEA
jgi:hypothetical protein